MKILFIETPPSFEWEPESAYRSGGRRHTAITVTGEMSYNYWNLYAASVLRENGYDVNYIHAQSEEITYKELRKKVESISPDIIVLPIEHIKAPVDFEIAKLGKSINATIVFVGPFVTALQEDIFKRCKYVDIVVLREYEYTILDIANALKNNKSFSSVSGILYKKDKRIIRTKPRELIQDLDKLPIPAYDLIDLRKFVETVFIRLPAATTITSRGCPAQCVFCTFPNTIYSHQFRAQSPEKVLEEAKFLVDKFKIKEIRYDDDTFEVNQKRAIDICKLLKKEDLDLTWQPQSRPDLMNDKLCKAMADSGCVKILFGVESGDDEILRKMRKGMTTDIIRRGVMTARKYGIYLHNCFMVGFIWDTLETIQKTFNFAYELNGEFTQFSIATPLPGTPYYEIVKNSGYLISDFWDRDSFHNAGVNFPNLSAEEINRISKEAYTKFYMRPEYIALMLRNSIRSRYHFTHFLRMMKAFYDRKRSGWI